MNRTNDPQRQVEPVVVVYTSAKPGVGKSTAAVLQACAWTKAGFKVGYVDADTNSQTASSWEVSAAKRGQPLGFERISAPHDRVADEALDHFGDCDIIIIDVGGGQHHIAMAAMRAATLVILATTCSPFDYEHVPAANRIVEAGLAECERSNVETFVLLGRVDARSRGYTDELAAKFLTNGLDTIENYLSDRKAYERIKNKNPYHEGLDMSEVDAINKELEDFIGQARQQAERH